jgi:hypothetical protein
VKTHAKLYSDNPNKYLDGEPKITTKEIVESLQFCEKCGYVYEGYDYSFWQDNTPGIPPDYKKVFLSDTYQNVIKNTNIDPHYKKLLLYDLILGTATNDTKCSLYHEYKYQFEKENAEEEQKLLELKLQETINNSHSGANIPNNTLCYNNRLYFSINQQELIVDILRRLGRFEEAKAKIIKYLDENEKPSQGIDSKREYYMYQLKLVETQDKRHI